MPFIPALTSSDGVFMDLCIDCSWIVGFDSEAVKKAVAKLTGDGEEKDGKDDVSQKCKRLTQNTKRAATSIGWVWTARS